MLTGHALGNFRHRCFLPAATRGESNLSCSYGMNPVPGTLDDPQISQIDTDFKPEGKKQSLKN